MQVVFINSRIEDFLESLESIQRQRITRMLNLLEQHGKNLNMPYSKSLGKGLFELRIVGVVNIRLLYTFNNNQVWIVHGFIKKTNQVGHNEITYARKQIRSLH